MDSIPLGSIKLNFDGCALGKPSQLGIGSVIMDYNDIVLRPFSKLVGVGLAIEAKILALLEGLLQTKALDLSNFLVKGDYAIVISQMSKLESGLWQYNKWLHQILDLANILNCSFFGSPCSTSKITDHLAKCKAKQIVSFVGIFFMP